MPYDLTRLQADVAQVQHDAGGFGTGRLVAKNLILTAAHVLTNGNSGRDPKLGGWQVRLARDRGEREWLFRRDNMVVWHDLARDLALIEIASPLATPLYPLLHMRVATITTNDSHRVEARGFPRASKPLDGPRVLTSAYGRLTAGENDQPLRFGVDQSDLPNDPYADWKGMSGSTVLLQESPDPKVIWIYGVVSFVPDRFDGQLGVARLSDVWQEEGFRKLLVTAGAPDKVAIDPFVVRESSYPAREKKIVANVREWFRLEPLSFTNSLYEVIDESGILKDVRLEIVATDLAGLMEFVTAQGKETDNAARAAEQREQVRQTRWYICVVENVGVQLLSNASAAFGFKNSIECLDRFVGLCLSRASWDLGHYQASSGPILFDSFQWFEGSHPAQISQFVYGQSPLLEIFIEPEPYSKVNTTVYVPLDRLHNVGDLLLPNVRDECKYIPHDIWRKFIVPQLAFWRTLLPDSYWPATQEEGFYVTEGKVWNGDSAEQSLLDASERPRDSDASAS
jgi:hypothetical protein